MDPTLKESGTICQLFDACPWNSSGGDFGAAFQGGIIGGVSGGVTDQIGHGGIFKGENAWFSQALAHGVFQGLISEIQGGEFQAGLASGFVAKVGGHYLEGTALDNIAGISILGGLASKAAGGDFLQGAIQAAFVYVYNDQAGGQNNGKSSNRDDSDSLLEDQEPPSASASWITRLKAFFGLPGGSIGNVAAKVGGPVVNTGIMALDTDVAKGVLAIKTRQNLNLCENVGQCVIPDDRIEITQFLSESPPNLEAIRNLFVRREWQWQ